MLDGWLLSFSTFVFTRDSTDLDPIVKVMTHIYHRVQLLRNEAKNVVHHRRFPPIGGLYHRFHLTLKHVPPVVWNHLPCTLRAVIIQKPDCRLKSLVVLESGDDQYCIPYTTGHTVEWQPHFMPPPPPPHKLSCTGSPNSSSEPLWCTR